MRWRSTATRARRAHQGACGVQTRRPRGARRDRHRRARHRHRPTPHVVNYEPPNVPRTTCTASAAPGAPARRARRSPVCVDEEGFLRDIERLIKRQVPREIVPGFEPNPNERPEPIVLGRMVIGEGAAGYDVRRRPRPRGRPSQRQRRRDRWATARHDGPPSRATAPATVVAAAVVVAAVRGGRRAADERRWRGQEGRTPRAPRRYGLVDRELTALLLQTPATAALHPAAPSGPGLCRATSAWSSTPAWTSWRARAACPRRRLHRAGHDEVARSQEVPCRRLRRGRQHTACRGGWCRAYRDRLRARRGRELGHLRHKPRQGQMQVAVVAFRHPLRSLPSRRCWSATALRWASHALGRSLAARLLGPVMASCRRACVRSRRAPWRGRWCAMADAQPGAPARRRGCSRSDRRRADAPQRVVGAALRYDRAHHADPLFGAAGTVTGSRHLRRSGRRTHPARLRAVQGLKALRERNWAPFPVEPASITAVVLSHAHLDHRAAAAGPRQAGLPAGSVRASPATWIPPGGGAADSAPAGGGRPARQPACHCSSRHAPALPLYTVADAEAGARASCPRAREQYPDRIGRPGAVAGGPPARRLRRDARRRRHEAGLLRRRRPRQRSADAAAACRAARRRADRRIDVRRPAAPARGRAGTAAGIIRATVRRGGRGGGAVVRRRPRPGVAVARAAAGCATTARSRCDPPVFLDSPMATQATALYQRHSAAAAHQAARGGVAFATASLPVAKAADSEKLTRALACVIISASGMVDRRARTAHLI